MAVIVNSTANACQFGHFGCQFGHPVCQFSRNYLISFVNSVSGISEKHAYHYRFAIVEEREQAMVEDGFWAKTDRTTGCWRWKGSHDRLGYGLSYRPKSAGSPRFERAHRKAWRLTHGPIPEGMHVLHSCDVRDCINPDHLWIGTHQDNMKDRNDKGKNCYGESNGNSRLTKNKVTMIRKAYALGGVTQTQLAKQFNVTGMVISKIVRGIMWRHIL